MGTRLISMRFFLIAAVVAGASLLVACGDDDDGASPSQTTTSNPTGTLAGTVVAGPACAVEQVGVECPPIIAADVEVIVSALDEQTVLESVRTDADGVFSVELAAGSYVVQAQPDSPAQISQPLEVAVSAGATTSVELLIDTGIR